MKRVKREAHFTRILEFQVELASWQHEGRRLNSLCQEPSMESNLTAQKEVDVYLQRVSQLEAEFSEAQERRSALEAELADVEADHTAAEATFKEQEQELIRQQDLTRELAVAFKQLLQARKQSETLQDEIETLDLTKHRHEQELAALKERVKGFHDARAKLKASVPPPENRKCLPISKEVLYAKTQPTLPGGIAEQLQFLNRAASNSCSSSSVFSSLLKLDKAGSGVLPRSAFEAGLQAWPRCVLPPEEAAASLVSLLPVSPPAESIPWLDVLVSLECLGDSTSSCAPVALSPYPELAPFRSACLRRHVGSDELRERLLALESFEQAAQLFGSDGLGLPSPELSKWTKSWQSMGSHSLLLQLPLSAATMSAAAMKAWHTRCFESVQSHRKELLESFTVWRSDMMLTEEQFFMVCTDVLGEDLSEDDISDLALIACQDGASGPERISGEFILNLKG